MVRPTFKVSCPWCKKMFFTKEPDKKFCTDGCEAKCQYKQLFPKGIKEIWVNTKTCQFCSEQSTSKFCTTKCKNDYAREQTTKNSKNEFLRDKTQKHRFPYEVLNKMAEKDRLYGYGGVFTKNYGLRKEFRI